VGTALVMAFTAWILTWGTWRDCFTLPGWMCIAAGISMLFLLADTPESRGLQSVKAFANDPHPDPADFNFRDAFIKQVLRNRNVWAIGLIDLCVYAVRFGTLDWTTKFLIEDKGYVASEAAARASLMPAAGVVGVLVTGFASDRLFRGRYREVNAIALAMLVVCIWGFWATPKDMPWLELVCMAGIGFFVEGPQSILGGVGAIDAAGSARIASSAAGLVGVLSYTGASLSGVGTGWFIDHYRWGGAFAFWIACTVLGFLLCVFVWKEKRPAS
jgi:sugar phosphate permease